MKNTRRTFLQSLAAVPLLGRVFASAKPAVPSLLPLKVDTSGPVYGFDERVMLRDLGQETVIAGEELLRGDLVIFSKSVLCKDTQQTTYRQVVKATLNDRPIGIATRLLEIGDEVQEYVLVHGVALVSASSMVVASGNPVPRSSLRSFSSDAEADAWWADDPDRDWPTEDE